MRKKDVEIALEMLDRTKDPNNILEQYATPPTIAADVLHTAYMYGDVESKVIADLGCGNGIFAIGAMMMGAKYAFGIDIDRKQIEIAVSNSEKMGVTTDFRCMDVSNFNEKVDTIFENPPFGAQKRNSDIPFLKKLKLGSVSYMLYNENNVGFVIDFIKDERLSTEVINKYRFPIPYMFKFHKKEKEYISVMLLRVKNGEK